MDVNLDGALDCATSASRVHAPYGDIVSLQECPYMPSSTVSLPEKLLVVVTYRARRSHPVLCRFQSLSLPEESPHDVIRHVGSFGLHLVNYIKRLRTSNNTTGAAEQTAEGQTRTTLKFFEINTSHHHHTLKLISITGNQARNSGAFSCLGRSV